MHGEVKADPHDDNEDGEGKQHDDLEEGHIEQLYLHKDKLGEHCDVPNWARKPIS